MPTGTIAVGKPRRPTYLCAARENDAGLGTADPEVQGGRPCFTGTRVPARHRFDAVSDGRTLGGTSRPSAWTKREPFYG